MTEETAGRVALRWGPECRGVERGGGTAAATEAATTADDNIFSYTVEDGEGACSRDDGYRRQWKGGDGERGGGEGLPPSYLIC